MLGLDSLKPRLAAIARKNVVYSFRSNIKVARGLVSLIGVFAKSYRNTRILPIEWLDENNSNIIVTLEPEEFGYAYSPSYIGESQRVEKICLPSVRLYCFDDARVSILSSSLIVDNKITIERVGNVGATRASYAQGYIVEHDDNSAIVRAEEGETIDKGIFLGGNGAFNYYHWMIEILPKLKYLSQIEQCGFKDFPVLVSEDVETIRTFQEALNMIVQDKPIRILKKDKAYSIGKLLYISTPNNLPFNLRAYEKMLVTDFVTRPSAVHFLRNKLLTRQVLSSGSVKSGQRIFFARRNARRQYNYKEIWPIFERQGFRKAFMDELSLTEQMALISNAEAIAGPTGAEWTNLIFCSPDTKCLCWMADGYGDFAAYSTLAKIVGADLRYLTYRADAKSTGDLYTAGYYIAPDAVEQATEGLLVGCLSMNEEPPTSPIQKSNRTI